ncbi:MAG: general secretion pathway protein GspK [Verrucomicrobiales bacterium]|nr:general secretion pathway protein GspK [Verrucomicrobiales bacterium]
MTPIPRVSRKQERGTILIIVLWVSLGLVTITLLFGHSMMLNFRSADNHLASLQAEQAVEAGIRYAGYVLANVEVPGEMPEEDTYARQMVPVGDAAFWFLSHSGETGTRRQRVFALNDEAGKLNLNTATTEMLEGLPGMTAELAAAIVDWRDEDDELTEGGAESQYYQFLDPSYACKNAPFESVEELRLVAGMSATLLYGEDANRNGLLDANENDGNTSWPPDDQDGVLDEGIINYLTVYSSEPNTDPDGGTRINVTSGQQELATLLQDTFGDDRAQEIQQSLSGGQTVNSVLEFYSRSGMTAEEFAEIDDYLTASDDNPVEGLINVNTASEAVLACLPGMDEQKAESIVSTRRGTNTQLDSLAWVADLLDTETIRSVGPLLTSHCYQVTADVVAVGRKGRGYQRTIAVLDVSGETPQIIYREDLSGQGWSLGLDTLQQLTDLVATQR